MTAQREYGPFLTIYHINIQSFIMSQLCIK